MDRHQFIGVWAGPIAGNSFWPICIEAVDCARSYEAKVDGAFEYFTIRELLKFFGQSRMSHQHAFLLC